jgi:hypothetical protein
MALVHCAMPQEVDAQLRRAEVRRSMLPAEDEKRRRRPPTVRPSMPSRRPTPQRHFYYAGEAAAHRMLFFDHINLD